MNQKSNSSKPKRLARYSLRFLLLLMTAAGICLGLGAKYKSNRDAEKKAIEKFSPAYVHFDYQFNDESEIDYDRTPQGPKWIRERLDDDHFFSRARTIKVFYDDNLEAELPVDIPDLNGIGAFKKLESLNVSSTGLENIDGVADLVQLRSLSLGTLKQTCDLSKIGRLKNLRRLALGFEKGTEFSLESFTELESLESFSFFQWHSEVTLNDVEVLTRLPKLKHMTLRCKLQTAPYAPSGRQSLPSLERLELHCDTPTLGGLSVAPKLEQLLFTGCDQLDLSDRAISFPNLKTLKIEKCKALETFDGFSESSKIEKVSLRHNPKLRSIKGLEGTDYLTDLEIYDCGSLANLDGLSNNSALAKVWICQCKKLEDIGGLRGTKGITGFTLEGSPRLKSLDGLDVEQLKSFSLRRSQELDSIKVLKGARHLSSIVFEKCPKIKELELHPDAQLKKMQLVGNFSKESLLKTVRGQRDLGRFYLRDCNTLENLNLLQGCQTLESLSVIGWSNLTEITSPDFEEIPSLRRVELSRCDQLRSLEGIEKFKHITELEFRSCPKLSDVSQLAKLEDIRILEFDQCPEIKDPSFIRELKNLGKISRICFTRTDIPRQSLRELVAELGVEIICEGRGVKPAKKR